MSKRYTTSPWDTRPFKRAKPNNNVNAKITRLQRKVNLVAPELKHYIGGRTLTTLTTGSVSTLDIGSLIVQGTNANERVGDRIKIMKIVIAGQIFGATTGAMVDMKLVRTKGTSAPVYADYQSNIGSTLNPNVGWQLLDLGVDRSGLPVNSRKEYHWKNGLTVEFDRTVDAAIKNCLWLAHVNNSGSTASSINFSYVIYYYDA